MTSATWMRGVCPPGPCLRNALGAVLLVGVLCGITGSHQDILHVSQFLLWVSPPLTLFCLCTAIKEKSGMLDMSDVKAERIAMCSPACSLAVLHPVRPGIVEVKLFHTTLAHFPEVWRGLSGTHLLDISLMDQNFVLWLEILVAMGKGFHSHHHHPYPCSYSTNTPDIPALPLGSSIAWLPLWFMTPEQQARLLSWPELKDGYFRSG